ncbi:MAG: baseplate J/gp47 family protein [Treponema sp.]|jgi:uncharacterized phage protein gp47/JayE|nr:baseplate J/gp47 family protein [Treponema sp.]
MQESWIDKSDSVIRDDIVSIAKTNTGLTNFKSTGILRGFIEVLASVVFFIYKTSINPLYSNATLDGATGVFLSFWGLLLGVARKQKSKTTGTFNGAAYGDGSVAAGTWAVVTGTDIRFKVTADVSFAGGSAFAIPVVAEHPGLSYNIGAGIPIRLTRVVSGLDTIAVREDWIASPGQDEEDDDSYRERIKNRWKSQILGDTKDRYKFYAEAVDGVRAARIIRTPRGAGSADVIIAAVNGLPGSELLQAVAAALESHELMAFDVRIQAPEVEAVAIAIEYSGNASEGDVRLVAENYVNTLGIGDRFKINELYDLYKAMKLETIEVISPDRDVQPDDQTIIVAAVSVTKAAS